MAYVPAAARAAEPAVAKDFALPLEDPVALSSPKPENV